MTEPLKRAARKNPVLPSRLPMLPPRGSSRIALRMSAAAAEGRFELQVCARCQTVQYPPRESCVRCLSTDLAWKLQQGRGDLISMTELAHSHDRYFRDRLPWRLGMVRLDGGPTVIAHLHGDVAVVPARVRIAAWLDRAGRGVLVALPSEDVANMQDDRQLREMTCDPKFRKALVTDGKTAVGQALVRELVAAGAELVWVGYAEPWKKFPGFDELTTNSAGHRGALDVTECKIGE